MCVLLTLPHKERTAGNISYNGVLKKYYILILNFSDFQPTWVRAFWTHSTFKQARNTSTDERGM